ncbi:guanylate kinase [Haliangium sp.]|uniref:guanylate kinase n=1 Tax=Haliangium sp. TaxID=2663208 RepID=UPI003D0B6F39
MPETGERRGANRPERGLLVILSSPSGAGKTSLAHRLMEEFPRLSFSISVTTRAPRGAEVDGRDYHFVDDAGFDDMVVQDALAEWAEVHGNRYGTARASVEQALAEGRDMLFDIDWQGGRALAEKWPDDVLSVFVLPPSLDILAQRLRGRGTDAPEVIERRLQQAAAEIAHCRAYDYLLVNDDFDDAYTALRAIYLVARYGRHDRADLPYPLAELAAQADLVRSERMYARAQAILAGQRDPDSGRD